MVVTDYNRGTNVLPPGDIGYGDLVSSSSVSGKGNSAYQNTTHGDEDNC